MESGSTQGASRSRLANAAVAAAAVCLLLAVVRCSHFAGLFEKPQLEFRGIRVTSLGLDGASLEILVDVYNPNSYRLGLQRFSYDLAIEDVPFGSGSIESPLFVSGHETKTATLPLGVNWSRLGDLGREVLHTGSVQYGVSGEMTIATSLGQVRVPYSRSGHLAILPTGGRGADVIPDDRAKYFRSAARRNPSLYSIATTNPFWKMTFLPTFL